MSDLDRLIKQGQELLTRIEALLPAEPV